MIFPVSIHRGILGGKFVRATMLLTLLARLIQKLPQVPLVLFLVSKRRMYRLQILIHFSHCRLEYILLSFSFPKLIVILMMIDLHIHLMLLRP